MPPQPKLPRLPQLLDRKIYKTGQTRGADDDVIFQNRVSRNSTVLIPYGHWDAVSKPPEGEKQFDNGFIALITPESYFASDDPNSMLAIRGLSLGRNALVFYQLRSEWDAHPPDSMKWRPASSRTNPLGGQFVARIAGTTATQKGERINRGYTTTGCKGAGIRLFEYASSNTIGLCRIQLEALYWLCEDSVETATKFGMSRSDAEKRKTFCCKLAQDSDLLDQHKLTMQRLINNDGLTICPLCLDPLPSLGFFSRLTQAEGREVHDLTVTEINLFHIREVRYGEYNHRPYNLGWGHHHCNVVVKDSGILGTLDWMQGILERNVNAGLYDTSNRSISV
jgi:hypothetical protein